MARVIALPLRLSPSGQRCRVADARRIADSECQGTFVTRCRTKHRSASEPRLLHPHTNGIAAHHRIQADHGLKADSKTRLHVVDNPLDVCRTLRLEQVFQPLALAIVLAESRRYEDRI